MVAEPRAEYKEASAGPLRNAGTMGVGRCVSQRGAGAASKTGALSPIGDGEVRV